MSKPRDGEKISDWTLEYFRQRNKNNVHSLVVQALKELGISQVELAHRLGRRPEVINRWIGAPGNWTLDTVSDLLFAIDGLEVVYKTIDPFNGPNRNYESPEWLSNGALAKTLTGTNVLAPAMKFEAKEKSPYPEKQIAPSVTSLPNVVSVKRQTSIREAVQ